MILAKTGKADSRRGSGTKMWKEEDGMLDFSPNDSLAPGLPKNFVNAVTLQML